jgi:hypothetical protein
MSLSSITDMHMSPADTTDSNGNLICQNTVAAEQRRVEAENNFQSFPFRIQAFMRALSDEVSIGCRLCFPRS